MAKLGGWAVAMAIALGAGAAHADSVHLFSYDPADKATREAAGPLTFTFRKGLFHTTLLNLRSTEATATAYLRRADEQALGRGGLARIAAADPGARDLYAIEPDEQGPALIAAFCPGAQRAWMAFGPVKANRDLTVLVLQPPGADGKPRLCRTLRFAFHGEWVLPPGRSIDPRQLERPRFPGA